MTPIETIAIGDELLTGKIADTNSAFLGNELYGIGLRLSRQTVIPDENEVILSTLSEVAERARFAICFGGLGPTSDDLTVDCVAKKIGTEVVIHGPSEVRMREYYRNRKREVSEEALRQVRFPKSAKVIDNSVGMAPGFSVEIGKCQFFFLPGVPIEMKAMVTGCVIPEIAKKLGSIQLRHQTWRCLGIAESDLQSLMRETEAQLPKGPKEYYWTGYRTVFPENHFTLYGREATEAAFARVCASIREIVAPYSYTEENKELEEVVLKALGNKKIVTAESCTGGLIVQRLTRVPGASLKVFGGYVVYQIDAKEKQLGVAPRTDQEAVTPECTRALSQNALKNSGADLALAITGLMGPGGTPDYPEGTVHLALSTKEGKTYEEKANVAYRMDRPLRQWAASSFALRFLLKSLERN